jgi:DNA-binding NarL/FixJ family response regulator
VIDVVRRHASCDRVGARRIVIADDHEPMRVLLRTLLELEGMDVVGEAQDGDEAVALTLRHEPDVVLLDVNMPCLDGLGAAAIIRASRPRIRLLLHTGEPLDTALDRAAALELPVADKRDLHLTIQQLTASGEGDAPGRVRSFRVSCEA